MPQYSQYQEPGNLCKAQYSQCQSSKILNTWDSPVRAVSNLEITKHSSVPSSIKSPKLSVAQHAVYQTPAIPQQQYVCSESTLGQILQCARSVAIRTYTAALRMGGRHVISDVVPTASVFSRDENYDTSCILLLL